MKIKCELCSKKFDVNKHDGVCPKCGQKNYVMNEGSASNIDITKPSPMPQVTQTQSVVQDHHEKLHQEIHKQYEGQGHIVQPKKEFSPHYMVNVNNTSYEKAKEQKNPKIKLSVKDTIRIAVTICELLIVVGLVAYLVTRENKNNEEGTENGETYGESYDEEYSYRDDNDFFRFKAQGYDVGLMEVEKYYGEDTLSFKTPEGYELVSYVYTIDVEEGDFDYYNLWQITQVYMMTTEGICVEPMTYSAVSEWLEKDSRGIADMIDNEIFERQGILTFLIKEGTADHLIVDTYEGDCYERTLKQRYIMKE
ncbi:MAG: hypothetical protein IJX12_04035 [Lachnospiraceae bacterium]|nr:hypothetical protein [Lachnospiraceae bacterium]